MLDTPKISPVPKIIFGLVFGMTLLTAIMVVLVTRQANPSSSPSLRNRSPVRQSAHALGKQHSLRKFSSTFDAAELPLDVDSTLDSTYFTNPASESASQLVFTSEDSSNFYHDFVHATIPCVDADYDCSGHGRCVPVGANRTKQCVCDDQYATYDCDVNVFCCYKRTPRVGVFLLSFFVGFTGAHYFVVGQDGLGAGMLVLFVGGIFLLCCGAFLAVPPCICLGSLSVCANLVWQIACWIELAGQLEHYNGKHDIAIAPWP